VIISKSGLLVPFILQRNLRESIVSVSKALLHMSDSRRVALCSFLALSTLLLLLLFESFQSLHVTHSGKIKNLERGSQIVVFLLLLFVFSILK
jgi:hypothetical protein